MVRWISALLLVMLLVAVLSACGGGQVSTVFTETNSGLGTGGGASAPMPAATAAPAAAAREAVEGAPIPAAPLPAADAVVGGAVPETAPATSGAPAPNPGQRTAPEAALRAGEINDNERFAEYLDYLARYQWADVRPVDVREHHLIRVLDRNQTPVLDARLTLFDGDQIVWRGRTYAGGQALFLPELAAPSQSTTLRLVAEYDQARTETTLVRGESSRIEMGLADAAPLDALRLDLLFLLDTTGSMGDELTRIQQTIDSIAARIDSFTPRPSIRYGLVAYKDNNDGDEYVTFPVAFSEDLNSFRAALGRLSASGGGDIPEALDEAMYEAMVRMAWRDEPTVRLTFLVADAGPHVPGPSQFTYLDGVREAVARGVKIYPIAASNTDAQAEYVFRQLAQQTMGGFVFLTYQPGADGGAPGESTPLEAGDQPYTVERLDDLIVTIVERELAAAVGVR
ncbi:MAG: vWA domain-containing protein [Oscillochloridaceae bacterium umkhey_bin13]